MGWVVRLGDILGTLDPEHPVQHERSNHPNLGTAPASGRSHCGGCGGPAAADDGDPCGESPLPTVAGWWGLVCHVGP